MGKGIYNKSERYRNLIKWFILKYKPKCFFCGEDIEWEGFFPYSSGKVRDDVTIHHIDHNRNHNNIENLTICHRSCHRRYHRNEQLRKYNKLSLGVKREVVKVKVKKIRK